MGLFRNIFAKKTHESEQLLQVAPAINAGLLGRAELVANVVSAGIEQENFENMNQYLDEISNKEEAAEMYVFPQPGISGPVASILMCIILSCAFLKFILIGIGTLAFSNDTEHTAYVIPMLMISVAALILNVVMICRSVSVLRFRKRFCFYSEILRFKGLEYIENLAAFSGMPKNTVIRDLRWAVKQKLIPQGHFSRENIVFMVSNQLNNQYLQKPAVYDRYFRKQIEEKNRIESRTEEISQIIEMGDEYIQKIHDSNVIIKDKAVSRELDKMEKVVATIFHEIDVNPEYAHTLGLFLYSYLPTTAKLLEAYISLGEKKVPGKSLAKTKKEIEEAICKINSAFEHILERLYEEHEMDIISSIEALEIVMAQEGLAVSET